MQTLWTPSPAFTLLRRIVNVVSSLSIGQHYLLQKTPPLPSEASERKYTSASYNFFQSLGWLGWFSKEQATLSVAVDGHTQMHEPLRDPPPAPPPTHPQRTGREKPMDLIHRLLHNPTLYNPIRAPRNPVVLCHGISLLFLYCKATLISHMYRTLWVRRARPGGLSYAQAALLV